MTTYATTKVLWYSRWRPDVPLVKGKYGPLGAGVVLESDEIRARSLNSSLVFTETVSQAAEIRAAYANRRRFV